MDDIMKEIEERDAEILAENSEEFIDKSQDQYNEERLNALVEEGKRRGSLSSKELLDVLEDMNLEQEQIDRFYDTLENLNIDTTDNDETTYLPPDDIAPEIEELQEI